jgi:predicted dehydrogenase
MPDKKLRWGILSTAKIGLDSLVPAIRQSSNGEVAAIASRDKANAESTAARLSIPHAYGSYQALLESPEVDAVYNPLPDSMHREWSIRAAQSGKHVLCEKPFALNAAQVDEMIAAAKQHRVLLMEAFMYRFHPQYDQVRRLINQGAIGHVEVIRSAFCFRLENAANIRLNKELGGGALMDVGCYCLNVSRLIAGAEPAAVQATAALGKASQVDETFAAILRFPGDVIAHFDVSFRTDEREWADIQGSKGRIELTRPFKPGISVQGRLLLHHGNEHEELPVASANHYQLMVEHFADAALNGKPLRFSPEEGRMNMRVIDALYESAQLHREVAIQN